MRLLFSPVLLLGSFTASVRSFGFLTRTTTRRKQNAAFSVLLRPMVPNDDDAALRNVIISEDSNTDGKTALETSEKETLRLLFPDNDDTEFLDFVLEEHRPLGCTVDESLAHSDDKLVFVSKVTEGGFAEKAGVQVGDVILAVSGIFGELSPVIGVGIGQVRSLVTGRPKEESLSLRVARGTDVLDQHETALVDLCMTPGANDKQIENCVTTIMSLAYEEDDDEDDSISECDKEAECLLDDMFDMWNDDLPASTAHEVVGDSEQSADEEKEIKPWSSRSSPSGTYARDPATGKMVNIDEK